MVSHSTRIIILIVLYALCIGVLFYFSFKSSSILNIAYESATSTKKIPTADLVAVQHRTATQMPGLTTINPTTDWAAVQRPLSTYIPTPTLSWVSIQQTLIPTTNWASVQNNLNAEMAGQNSSISLQNYLNPTLVFPKFVVPTFGPGQSNIYLTLFPLPTPGGFIIINNNKQK